MYKLSINGSGNDLSPVWHLAITSTNADLLSIGPLYMYEGQKIMQNTKIFVQENVCKMVVIWFRPLCVKQS